MVAKQLSIFLENKSGRLTEVTEVLAKEGVNLSARQHIRTHAGIINGRTNAYKKAVVTLKEGDTIDFYSNI